MENRQLFIQWDSTNDCNLACSHCYHNREGNQFHNQNENLMSLSETKEMIDDLILTSKRWGMTSRFHISGGEPLMRKDLLEILDYTQFHKIPTRLLTNGTLITNNKAREISKRGIKKLQISLDGNKERHNAIRRKPFAYKKAIEGIQNCAENNISVTVSMTALQSNKNDLEDVLKNSIRTGAKKFGFQSYIPDSNLGLKDPEFLNKKETYELFKELRELSKTYGNKIHILETEVLWDLMHQDNYVKKESRDKKIFIGGCGAGYSGVTILSDGTVYPCRRLPIKIGNIKEGLISLITEKEVMQNLRDLEKMRENSDCDKVTYCRGCRAVAYAVTRDYMAKDPMCFKEFVKKEDLK